MAINPQEEKYPEGFFDEFSLKFKWDYPTKQYTLSCKEWHCEFPCGNSSKTMQEAMILLNEILDHNDRGGY